MVTFTRVASLAAIVLLVLGVGEFQSFRTSHSSAQLMGALVLVAVAIAVFAVGALRARRAEHSGSNTAAAPSARADAAVGVGLVVLGCFVLWTAFLPGGGAVSIVAAVVMLALGGWSFVTARRKQVVDR